MFPPAVYLKKLSPFSFLTKEELKEIINGLESEIFSRGEIIFEKGNSPLKYVYLLKCGRVLLIDEDNDVRYKETLKEGEIFGVASVLSSNPPKLTAVADDECVCYLIKKENFLKVFNSNKEFSDFFVKLLTKRLSSLLKLSKVSKGYEHLYATPVIELVSKKPVTCFMETNIREASKLMTKENVGSVVIVDKEGKARGIFTQKDLSRVVASNISLDDEISKHMSSPVIEINEDATVMEAYLMMVSNGINHLVITADEKIKGVISSKDILLKLESFSSLLSLSRKIISLEEKELLGVMPKILECMEDMALKINFSEISRVASGIYDLIIEKIINSYQRDLSKNIAWIKTDIAGRKEMVFPEIYSLIVYRDEKEEEIKKFINFVKGKLLNLGFDIKYLKLLPVSDIETYIENINDKELVEFYDNRLLYGDNKLYNAFLTILEKKIKDIEQISANFCISEKDDYLAIVHGLRALSIAFGIFDVKNTEERGKLLEDKIHNINISEVLESYRVVSDIKIRKKFYYKIERVDELLLKESKKILMNFKKFIGDKYAIKTQV